MCQFSVVHILVDHYLCWCLICGFLLIPFGILSSISMIHFMRMSRSSGLLYFLVSSFSREHTCTYGLQEEFIADQLFQGSEHTLDDMIWTNDSILSLMKVSDLMVIFNFFVLLFVKQFKILLLKLYFLHITWLAYLLFRI